MVGKNLQFNFIEKIKAEKGFEKTLFKSLKIAFYGETVENAHGRIKVDFFCK